LTIAIKLLQPIHHLSRVNAFWGFTTVVFPIEVDVLPIHGTHAFDLIDVLRMPLEFLGF
jgi:hypothetical protein